MGVHKNKTYPLRIDETIISKIKVIAEDQSRSANKQIEVILKEWLNNYESHHGAININVGTNNGNINAAENVTINH